MRATSFSLMMATLAAAGCGTRPLEIGHGAGGLGGSPGGGTGSGTGGASGGGGEAGRSTGGSGGTAAAGAAGGSGGGDAAGTPVDVTTALDGQKYLMPCGRDYAYSLLECQDTTCPLSGGVPGGHIFRDDTVTIDGPAGAVYDVTLRVRGVVEPKHYVHGAPGEPANGTNYGWYVGGDTGTTASYGVYMLWVSSPVVAQTGTGDGQYYFFNAINHPEAHFSYPIDYTVTLPIAAGAQVRYFAADPNCVMVKNCNDTSVDSASPTSVRCNPSTIADLPASSGIVQPSPTQFIYLTVVSVVAE
jgi:hypothetical protein